MMNKKLLYIICSGVIIYLIISITIWVERKGDKAQKPDVTTVGLTPSKQQYFTKQLSSSFRDVRLLEKGDQMIKDGKSDKAIEYFENLIKSNKDFEMKELAKHSLADAYEKKREYVKAYEILYEKSKKFKVPVTDEVRVPYEERLKYLMYASQGEYELAIEHAKLAMEADSKLSTNTTELYQQRLNDLKASREYIESLKK